MNERLKKLRKSLDLTQQAFANRIGIARGNIGAYEVGKNAPSDAVISLICREFNVNEKWLRTGEGDMFFKLDKENELMQWAGKVLGNEANSFKKNFIRVLMSLTEDEWELLERKAKELVNYEKENLY